MDSKQITFARHNFQKENKLLTLQPFFVQFLQHNHPVARSFFFFRFVYLWVGPVGRSGYRKTEFVCITAKMCRSHSGLILSVGRFVFERIKILKWTLKSFTVYLYLFILYLYPYQFIGLSFMLRAQGEHKQLFMEQFTFFHLSVCLFLPFRLLCIIERFEQHDTWCSDDTLKQQQIIPVLAKLSVTYTHQSDSYRQCEAMAHIRHVICWLSVQPTALRTD